MVTPQMPDSSRPASNFTPLRGLHPSRLPSLLRPLVQHFPWLFDSLLLSIEIEPSSPLLLNGILGRLEHRSAVFVAFCCRCRDTTLIAQPPSVDAIPRASFPHCRQARAGPSPRRASKSLLHLSPHGCHGQADPSHYPAASNLSHLPFGVREAGGHGSRRSK
jgi:hypothetical protein